MLQIRVGISCPVAVIFSALTLNTCQGAHLLLRPRGGPGEILVSQLHVKVAVPADGRCTNTHPRRLSLLSKGRKTLLLHSMLVGSWLLRAQCTVSTQSTSSLFVQLNLSLGVEQKTDCNGVGSALKSTTLHGTGVTTASRTNYSRLTLLEIGNWLHDQS